MKTAIVGSGISGLSAAYLLHPHHDITLFEKNDYLGGHSRTREVITSTDTVHVDTGFIVFNEQNYPNLCSLFDKLGVATENSDMSFGVSIDQGWLEYSSNHMFAQKSNLLSYQYLKMLKDIMRFNRQAHTYLDRAGDITIQQCLEEMNLGTWFREYYLLAMGAAIWSCPVETMLQFPAKTFIRFFKNHGLLTVNQHPQWKTVTGGSREYVKKLVKPFQGKIRLNTGIKQVNLKDNGIEIETVHSDKHEFDNIVFACHADQALNLIKNAPEPIQDVLNHFQYQNNRIVLHRDVSFMPKNSKCWSSWVYLTEANHHSDAVSLTYWMNNLQNIDKKDPILITLNPGRTPDPELVYEEHEFSHPVFNIDAIKAQKKIEHIQGLHGLWFCGAYQRYGFHEDGLLSTINMLNKMKIPIPW